MKKFWQDIEAQKIEQKNNDDHQSDKFNGVFDTSPTNRRDFLKLFGFSLAGVTVLAGCEKPIQKAIPFLNKPEDLVPGKAKYYASTFYDGDIYSSILVKVRDGRPIKIEGNDLSPLTQGRSNAIVQASVLELYDENRIRSPYIDSKPVDWETVDKQIIKRLNDLRDKGEKVVLLTSTIISPSTLSLIDGFKLEYRNIEHIMYDAISVHGMLEANVLTFGKHLIPNYIYSKAKIVVGFNADFLGNWIAPIEFSREYTEARCVEVKAENMLRHIQFETGMSLTGSNADERYSIKPSEERALLTVLYASISNTDLSIDVQSPDELTEIINELAKELLDNKGQSLVLSGSNDVEIQILVNAINNELHNYGSTIDFNSAYITKRGNDKNLSDFINELVAGKIAGVMCYNVNPVYELNIGKYLSELEFSVSFASAWDETTNVSKYICPDSHYLESWNDANPIIGEYSLAQPCIQKLFDTRQVQDCLLKWSGEELTFYTYLKKFWLTNFKHSESDSELWNKAVQDGVMSIETIMSTLHFNYNMSNLLSGISSSVASLELYFYENTNIGSGRHTNNPWLQETPEPISKVCWDNYATVSPQFAKDNSLETGNVIRINDKLELPVLVQPGQKYGTMSIAYGYGRSVTGIAGKNVGVNAYELVKFQQGSRQGWIPVTFSRVERKHDFAKTQLHNSMEERPLIREMLLKDYLANQSIENTKHTDLQTPLYKKHEYPGHHWGMTVDLNKCVGCNACVVACSAENNVPVVGKSEIQRKHEMHWLRIDRYYSGEPENPKVVVQPVMCQHCDNAPCENVCPVAATVHSSEGINQMTYNRCIGTRYCNVNCPYKVRRFNWFDYTKADALSGNTKDPAGMTNDLPRMVLNPDVTVRAKGVMEKCSFCVQRIQEKKLQAKLEGRPLKDGEIKTACQQACPTKAIVFGDMNNAESEVVSLMKSNRNYHLLEELNTMPSVAYLAKVSKTKKIDVRSQEPEA